MMPWENNRPTGIIGIIVKKGELSGHLFPLYHTKKYAFY